MSVKLQATIPKILNDRLESISSKDGRKTTELARVAIYEFVEKREANRDGKE